jgi:hypothetical protein
VTKREAVKLLFKLYPEVQHDLDVDRQKVVIQALRVLGREFSYKIPESWLPVRTNLLRSEEGK